MHLGVAVLQRQVSGGTNADGEAWSDRAGETDWMAYCKYDMVEGKYLYNRCHLIGYQLTAENANEKNLITGTRYMNTEGMLPFENMVADYIKETGNHVMYRVTPVFEGENLVASGVQMEAESVEDQGADLSFNVYVYNVQPGVEIDYKTGESREQTNFCQLPKTLTKQETLLQELLLTKTVQIRSVSRLIY